jgi:hypothetical protein
MATYKVTVNHEFWVTTNDLDKVRDNIEFTEFLYADEVEFIEGSIDWEEAEVVYLDKTKNPNNPDCNCDQLDGDIDPDYTCHSCYEGGFDKQGDN